MLSTLHIENIAVIEEAEIEFDRGFNVLTGETGAGKSIVIDAISAILGERASREMIRTGAAKAFVSAIFTDVPQLSWFEENQVPFDRELSVTREIYADGKNSCRVNGRPVTVTTLRRLGAQLIQIHGQNDSQQLFDEATHIGYLDLFAHDEALLDACRQAYDKVSAVRQEIRRLSMDESEKLRLVETLKFQIAEIERAELQPGEEETLLDRRKVLQNAEMRRRRALWRRIVRRRGRDDRRRRARTGKGRARVGRYARAEPEAERSHVRRAGHRRRAAR